MTPEEIERAIETLLNNQANFEIRLEKTNQQLERTDQQLERTDQQLERTDRQLERTDQQLEETTKRVDALAETQTEFIRIVTRHIEAQGEINNSIRQSVKDLSVTVERYISEGRNGKA